MILKELQEVPKESLADVYSVVHALKEKSYKRNEKAAEIFSYAGVFSDMADADYDEFEQETKQIRAGLFDREFDL